jgi:hypothetical protein
MDKATYGTNMTNSFYPHRANSKRCSKTSYIVLSYLLSKQKQTASVARNGYIIYSSAHQRAVRNLSKIYSAESRSLSLRFLLTFVLLPLLLERLLVLS